MTPHEHYVSTLESEIVEILTTNDGTRSLSELHAAIVARGRFRHRDGSAVTIQEIHRRTLNFRKLFAREGELVILREAPPQTVSIELIQYRIWNELASAASSNRLLETDRFEELASGSRRIGRNAMKTIEEHCRDSGLPPLQSLWVDAKPPQPTEIVQAVYSFDWSSIPNPFEAMSIGPTIDELVRRLVEEPSSGTATEIFQLVAVRGNQQRVFREALLSAYEGACAFCGLTLRPALQAAHIVPWADASDAERVSVNNGLLLCANHHALFDANVIELLLDGTLKFRGERGPNSRPTVADQQTAALEGRAATLPSDARLRPSAALLSRRQNERVA